MAGDWIKMRNNLWDDPRVSNICDLTGSTEAAVIGALYWLWAAADEHTESGYMPGLTVASIDRKTGVQGFAGALLSIGWLTQDADGLTINNFEEHNGSSAKKRCADAQRKANVRATTDKTRTSGGPTRTDSGQKEPNRGAREEKRREELPLPNGSGGEPPEEATKAELWKAGKSLLAEQGMPEKQCGSFVGKLCRDWTDAVVLEAVRTTVVKRPADVAQFLVATCQALAGKRDRAEPGWRTEQRERTQLAAPGVAAAGKPADQFFIDVKATERVLTLIESKS